ncbi:MAG: amino acid ABC transporter permease [Burkholderiaceae bacterium]|nr:amino acid ABC transporter permease [Burkholderiaceae bacterium]
MYNWNWKILWDVSPDGVNTYLQTLINGLGWTLTVALGAWLMALVLGTVIGVIRTTPVKWAVKLCDAYVEVFRNIPLLVQMFLWFYVMPEFLPGAISAYIKASPSYSVIAAVICLGFFTSARVAEQVKAGIQSLPRGQSMAGTALGLTLPQTYRYVLLPMAGRIVIPPLTSEFLNVIKNSAVAFTISVVELMGAARSMQEFSFQVFEAFTAATIIFLIVNGCVILLMRTIERFARVPGFIVSGGGGH